MTAAALATDDSAAGTLRVALSGDWLLGHGLPGPDPVLDRLSGSPKPAAVAFETAGLGDWDTGLVTALVMIHRSAEANGVSVDDSGLPEGARKLIALAFAVKEREGARRTEKAKPLFQQVGEGALEIVEGGRETLEFTGELVQSAGRFLRGKATFLRSDVFLHVQEAGANAFPIVSLISFLIGTDRYHESQRGSRCADDAGDEPHRFPGHAAGDRADPDDAVAQPLR
jgi:phospholipid/cholesterol/gamma-HCH transport system permease protein